MKAIQGKTYPVKDQLKALGGQWDPQRKVWMVPDDKEAQANKIVGGGSPGQATVVDSGTHPCPRCRRQQLPSKYKQGAWYCPDKECRDSVYSYGNGSCWECGGPMPPWAKEGDMCGRC